MSMTGYPAGKYLLSVTSYIVVYGNRRLYFSMKETWSSGSTSEMGGVRYNTANGQPESKSVSYLVTLHSGGTLYLRYSQIGGSASSDGFSFSGWGLQFQIIKLD